MNEQNHGEPMMLKKIEYVIDYEATFPGVRSALDTALASYAPTYMRLVPRASVFVTSHQEEGLLAVLAAIKGISYRRGIPRRALDDYTEEP